jgi:prefoldin beta subunit
MEALNTQAKAKQQEFNQLREDMQQLSMTRQQLVIQLNENEGVKEEFGFLSSTAVLYREIGPSLVRADLSDAKSLVAGRIDMITKEIKRIEDMVEMRGKRQVEIQQEMQNIRLEYQKITPQANETPLSA